MMKLSELSYEGNVGVMELVKFFDKASPQQIRLFKSAIDSKMPDKAWKMVQQVTGTKLRGMGEAKTVDPKVSEIRRAWRARFAISELARDAIRELDSIIRSGKVAKGQDYDRVTRKDNRMAAKYVVNAMRDIIGKLDQIDKMGL